MESSRFLYCAVISVGGGARWSEIIPYLDARGLSVWVMQSNNDFTVGGSISCCVGISADQTWTAQLGAASHLRAYNLSVPGVGPYEYLQVLGQIGVAFKPMLNRRTQSGRSALRNNGPRRAPFIFSHAPAIKRASTTSSM